MLFYDFFYRYHGVRRQTHLTSPPLADVQDLHLPRDTIFHFHADGSTVKGPTNTDMIFREINKQIPVGHVIELMNAANLLGYPQRLGVNLSTEIRRYHIENRHFVKMVSLEASTRDSGTLVVYNYALLNQAYRYRRDVYREYYRAHNLVETVIANVADTIKKSNRYNFIPVRLPKLLPSQMLLNMMSSGPITQKLLHFFDSSDAIFMLEIWKWLSKERKDSALAAIPEKDLFKVVFLYQNAGKWFALNLGVLNQWRAHTLEEHEADESLSTNGISTMTLQRYFLRMMMSLAHEKTVTDIGVIADTDEVVESELRDPNEGKEQQTAKGVVIQSDDVPVVDPVSGSVKQSTAKRELNLVKPEDFDEPDTKVLVRDKKLQEQMDKDLDMLEQLTKKILDQTDEEGVFKPTQAPKLMELKSLEQAVMEICEDYAETGSLSAAEYRRFEKLSASYKNIPAPDNSGKTLDEFIKIPPEVLQIKETATIKDQPTVFDKSMLQSTLLDFDSRYIREVLQRDIANMVMALQNAGIAVTDYQVEDVEDAINSFKIYTVRVTPVVGASSTLRFKIPNIAEDGTYISNKVKYTMRKQRKDLPIRKTGPGKVALTSYYGKSFVNRSTKKVNDYGTWLCDSITEIGLQTNSDLITDMQPADVFDNHFRCPRLYSILAHRFRSFVLTWSGHIEEAVGNNRFEFMFDHKLRKEFFGEDVLKLYEKQGRVVFAKTTNDAYLIVDEEGIIYSGRKGEILPFRQLEELLGLDPFKAPVDFAELKIVGKSIPLGFVLAYKVGLDNLLQILNVNPRRVDAGGRLNLSAHEFPVAFGDETLIFSRDDRLAALIMGGFNAYHRSIKNYNTYEFNRPDVYLNVLEAASLSNRYLREINLMFQMFIDPITRDLLVEMKEPTNMRDLLIRAAELLLTDQHLMENDAREQRMVGMERMAGAVYFELVRSVRDHNARPGISKHAIDLPPFAVWSAISTDQSVMTVSDINPVNNLHERESVTYTGLLGRSSRSITKTVRAYDESEMGTMSERTSDSSDVGINTALSANPQFRSLRGMSHPYDKEKTGTSSLLSTAALMAPGSDRDDPKRVNFVGIQQRHGVACPGYKQAAVRTGYEGVIAHRVSDMFAATAKQDGVVKSVSEEGIVIEYADGTTKGHELGRRYGSSEGLVIPHNIVTKLKEGQKVKVGDVICYNDGFFEPDFLNPSNVVWKAGVIVKTALWESTDTLEDSSAISTELSHLLRTKITKPKTIVVRFDQKISRMVKEGQAVNPEDILCIIEDAVTANTTVLSESDLDTLRNFSHQAPQAKMKGVVERIEVYYHAIDKSGMSESLRALADASDRAMAKRARAAGKKVFTGSTDAGFRVEGEPLAVDTMAIQIFITGEVNAESGDKGVFFNQMKTVFGRVMTGDTRTESGTKIDAIFGYKSIADRIVLSPEMIGTTTTLLRVIAGKAVEAYKS